jgi:catechol 2,3-dioxygenase-like lactoylglutathione lyase family enzyme
MDPRIDHVHAVAIGLDKSIAFYALLGFKLLRRVAFGPEDTRRELAYVGNAGSVIELVLPRDPENPVGGGTGLRPFAMAVTDADAVTDELEAEGVEVIMRARPAFSFAGRTAVIRDPSGIEIELREWAAIDGPTYPAWTPEREDVVNVAP